MPDNQRGGSAVDYTCSATPDPSLASALKALARRLHFYIGLLVGPFVFVAAFSGMLYALSPSLENWLYQDQLYTSSVGDYHTLERQIAVAREVAGPAARLSAVRPAPEPGTTTRVMFAGSELGPSESRAIFVDPVTLKVKGDLVVYGTSGALPLRMWIDQLHRSLLLGNVGRHYSELAASWLWIAALSGLALWWFSAWRGTQPSQAEAASGRGRLRRRHSTLGLFLLLGMLFFSATGLTWSQWAGGNIAVLRAEWGWGTPSVSTQLDPGEPMKMSEHAHGHHGASNRDAGHGAAFSPGTFDQVLRMARAAGLEAGLIEIQPSYSADTAWKVREIDRSWPTQVDAVAIDAGQMRVVDQVAFSEFPLAAKLTRWGIDLHMGVLFGLPNRLILAAFALGICIMLVWGYAMWWQRRPRVSASASGSLAAIAGRLPWPARLGIIALAAALGYALPVMGVSLGVFLVIDALRWWLAKRRTSVRLESA